MITIRISRIATLNFLIPTLILKMHQITVEKKTYTFTSPIIDIKYLNDCLVVFTPTQISFISSNSKNIYMRPYRHHVSKNKILYYQDISSGKVYCTKSFFSKPTFLLQSKGVFLGVFDLFLAFLELKNIKIVCINSLECVGEYQINESFNDENKYRFCGIRPDFTNYDNLKSDEYIRGVNNEKWSNKVSENIYDDVFQKNNFVNCKKYDHKNSNGKSVINNADSTGKYNINQDNINEFVKKDYNLSDYYILFYLNYLVIVYKDKITFLETYKTKKSLGNKISSTSLHSSDIVSNRTSKKEYIKSFSLDSGDIIRQENSKKMFNSYSMDSSYIPKKELKIKKLDSISIYPDFISKKEKNRKIFPPSSDSIVILKKEININSTFNPTVKSNLLITSKSVFFHTYLVSNSYTSVPEFITELVNCLNISNGAIFYKLYFEKMPIYEIFYDLELNDNEKFSLQQFFSIYLCNGGLKTIIKYYFMLVKYLAKYFSYDNIFEQIIRYTKSTEEKIFRYNNLTGYYLSSKYKKQDYNKILKFNTKYITDTEFYYDKSKTTDVKVKKCAECISTNKNEETNIFYRKKDKNVRGECIKSKKNHTSNIYNCKDIKNVNKCDILNFNSDTGTNNNFKDKEVLNNYQNFINFSRDDIDPKKYQDSNNFDENTINSEIDIESTKFYSNNIDSEYQSTDNHEICNNIEQQLLKINQKKSNCFENLTSIYNCAEIPLAYKIILANEFPEKYLHKKMDEFHFIRKANSTEIYKNYYEDTRIDEIYKLFENEEIYEIPYDDVDILKARESSYLNRRTASIGNAYFNYKTTQENVFLGVRDIDFKIKREENKIEVLEPSKNQKIWACFYHNCNEILSQPKIGSTQNVNCIKIKEADKMYKIKGNKTEPLSKFEISASLCGGLLGLGLKKEITEEIFLNYVDESDPLLVFTILISYAFSIQGSKDENMQKILDEKMRSKPNYIIMLGIILSYGLLFKTTNHYSTIKILINESNKKGPYVGKDNKGNRYWYNDMYRMFCTYALSMVCTEKSNMVRLNNSFNEIMVNGIVFAGSMNKKIKLSFFRDKYARLEEIFYSALFTNLIDMEKEIEEVLDEINVDEYLNDYKIENDEIKKFDIEKNKSSANKFDSDIKNENNIGKINSIENYDFNKNMDRLKNRYSLKNVCSEKYDINKNIDNRRASFNEKSEVINIKSKNRNKNKKIEIKNSYKYEKNNLDKETVKKYDFYGRKINIPLQTKKSEKILIDEDIQTIYKKSGTIFYIAFKCILTKNKINKGLFLKIYNLCLSVEEIAEKNKKYKIMFDILLITLSLIKNGSADINITRIIRRQIKKSQNISYLTEKNNFILGSSKDTQQFGEKYGNMMAYKICLGIVNAGHGMFEIKTNSHIVLDIIAAFYIEFPICCGDNEFINITRYFLLTSMEKKKDAFFSVVDGEEKISILECNKINENCGMCIKTKNSRQKSDEFEISLSLNESELLNDNYKEDFKNKNSNESDRKIFNDNKEKNYACSSKTDIIVDKYNEKSLKKSNTKDEHMKNLKNYNHNYLCVKNEIFINEPDILDEDLQDKNSFVDINKNVEKNYQKINKNYHNKELCKFNEETFIHKPIEEIEKYSEKELCKFHKENFVCKPIFDIKKYSEKELCKFHEENFVYKPIIDIEKYSKKELCKFHEENFVYKPIFDIEKYSKKELCKFHKENFVYKPIFDIEKYFEKEFDLLNKYDQKICLDILCDYFENNNNNINFEIYKKILCKNIKI